jgi:hypothetical protein
MPSDHASGLPYCSPDRVRAKDAGGDGGNGELGNGGTAEMGTWGNRENGAALLVIQPHAARCPGKEKTSSVQS